jgi:hypothetical protein
MRHCHEQRHEELITERDPMEDDRSIADLLATVAMQYRKQITDDTLPKNKTRLEILRRLELISQSIKGLMKYEQDAL